MAEVVKKLIIRFIKPLYLENKLLAMNRRHLLKGMGAIALYSSFPTILGEFLSSCNTKEKSLRAGFFRMMNFS
jgi:hypothetical protein